MRLRDFKIRNQLYIGLSIILVFVIILGLTAFFQSYRLWRGTAGIYNHPLAVRVAIGEIKADCIAIHRSMKDIILAEDKKDAEKALKNIHLYEATAYQQFDVLYQSYLGPEADIDTVYNYFIEWELIRDETVRLYREGDIEQATERTMDTGTGGSHFNILLESINSVSVFAERKAEEFYLDANDIKNDIIFQISLLTVLILIFSSLVIYVLNKIIGGPLKIINDATDKFHKGDYGARSLYSSKNEYGMLSDSFNSLAENIESAAVLNKSITEFSDLMLKEDNLKKFCIEFLKKLLYKTDSQAGAVYFLDETGTEFVIFESIGFNEKVKKSFSISEKEGELGLAAASKKIQHIKDIPEEAGFDFSAAASDFLPKEIITMPVISENEVIALITLSSIKKYTESSLKLLNEIWLISSARIGGLLASWKTDEIAKKLEQQNIELERQSQEISMQRDELSEQNAELEIQKNKLEEAGRLKNIFLSNMSHELRTPLNSIIALSGVLDRRLQNSIAKEDHGYISIIEKSGRNLLALINDLLDLSRIEAGKEELNISGFKVEELVDSIFEVIEPQAKEKNINFKKIIQKGIPVILSDFKKCQSILQNLAANAVKFTEKGTVRISAVVKDKVLFIEVRDTGIGIEKDKIDYIFDEFRQVDDTTAKKYEGTGLGLSIAKKYAAMLEGDIKVESMPGRGSTFTLKIPIKLSCRQDYNFDYIENEWKEIDRYSKKNDGFDYTDKTILIVEDSEPAIIQLKEMLGGRGVKIDIARNGKEAIEMIDKNAPDAMILDLMMPEVDGFEVLKNTRNKDKSSKIPILILTAKHITKEELVFLKGNNIYQLIQKGDISKKELIKAIDNILFNNAKETI